MGNVSYIIVLIITFNIPSLGNRREYLDLAHLTSDWYLKMNKVEAPFSSTPTHT